MIWMSLITVYVGWVVVLNFTAVAPVNPVPAICTEVPTGPLVGLKLVIVGSGGGFTVNVDGVKAEVLAVPPGVMTVICPVLAPAGTVVVMWESSVTV